MSSESDLEYLDYIESSSKALKTLEDQRDELQTKLAELKEEKVILEKVASTPTFSKEKLDKTIGLLATQNLVDPDYTEKVASMIEEDPEKILDLLTKLASVSYKSGTSIEKEERDSSEDEDGWGLLSRENRY